MRVLLLVTILLSIHSRSGEAQDEGAVQLVGGSTRSEGRVEVYHNGQWGTVCDDGWDVTDATVVCRQLGYIGATSAPEEAAFGAGSGPIHYDDVACTGSETRLADCSHPGIGIENCGHDEDASVVCDTTPVEGALRLVGGSTQDEGRVEVYHSGAWGTVCDDMWDITDATVVCRQLHYFRATSAPEEAAFGEGSGPIHYDNVDCNGSETRLADCSHPGIGIENCVHSEDAGVVCTDTQAVLNPVGVAHLCIGTPSPRLTLTCTTEDVVFWSTSGFASGVSDQSRASSLSLSKTSSRITTSDSSTMSERSTITLSDVTYGDHGATIACEDRLPTGLQSVTLSVGPPSCAVPLTVPSATENSVVVKWSVADCLGASPTQYKLEWYSVGSDTSSMASPEIDHTIDEYRITGLSPGTKYFVVLTYSSSCGLGGRTSVIAETLGGGGPLSATVGSLVAVIGVLFLSFLIVAAVLAIVCAKLRTANKKTSHLLQSANNQAVVRYVHHNEVAELPPLPFSAPKRQVGGVYEDMGQVNASEDSAMGTLYEQVGETRSLPAPPSFPAIESTAEPLYEGLSQYSESGDVAVETSHHQGTADVDYEGLSQYGESGNVVVETNLHQGTVDVDCEGLSQYGESGDVVVETSGDISTEANPCHDTVDS